MSTKLFTIVGIFLIAAIGSARAFAAESEKSGQDLRIASESDIQGAWTHGGLLLDNGQCVKVAGQENQSVTSFSEGVLRVVGVVWAKEGCVIDYAGDYKFADGEFKRSAVGAVKSRCREGSQPFGLEYSFGKGQAEISADGLRMFVREHAWDNYRIVYIRPALF